jgi:hypothetical protein
MNSSLATLPTIKKSGRKSPNSLEEIVGVQKMDDGSYIIVN